MADYNYVITSGYQPLSMQEALTPFVMYKDAYEKAEDKYEELSQKVGEFQYLADTLPEGSKARNIYEGYAKDYERYRDDFAKNGLNMISRNGLGTMRRRYAGEIGMLAKAQSALEKEQAIRREMSLKDPSMLYASNNFTIDDYLYGNTPNNYSISGDYLYSKGAQAGKSASSRIYSAGDKGSTLGGYYRDYVQTMGYSPETVAKFRQDASAIPELQEQADSILMANGVYDNLSGADLDRARAQVINGMIDGAVYTEQHSPQRDLGVLTKAEQLQEKRASAAEARAAEKWNLEKRELNASFNSRYIPKKNILGFPMLDANGEPMYELNPAFFSPNNDYEIDPNTGKLKKKRTSLSPEEKQTQKVNNSKTTAILKLKGSDLAHNSGFDVAFGGTNGIPADRHHYSYIGALANSKGKWRSGALGDDVPGHGWGMFSATNVENAWGNFSAEGSDDKNKMRVLSSGEINEALYNDKELYDTFDALVKKNGLDIYKDDIQVIEVPNERGGKRVGYLIAVRDK